MKLLFTNLLFFSAFFIIKAQEGIPVYQDYLTGSWYLIHPSTAGAASTEQIRLTGRTQWFDVDDAPSLFTASINARVNKNIGLGVIAYGDRNGNFSQNGIHATFAYHINMNARAYELNQLSFGISGIIAQRRLDSPVVAIIDPAIGGNPNDSFFNADFGMSYYKGDLFLLLTLRNGLPIKKDDFILAGSLEPDNQRQFIATAGYTFDLKENIDLEPSIQYITIPEIKEQIADFNIKAYYTIQENSRFFGGASYRVNFDGTETTQDNATINLQRFGSISPFFGIDYKDFVFAYTYTSQTDEIRISNSGFHQITLGYNFRSKRNLRDGQRECNCPAFK